MSDNWQEDAARIGAILRDQYKMQESPKFVDGKYEAYIPPPSLSSVTLKDLGKQTMTY